MKPLPPPSIIVLGKTSLTDHERDALETFGWGLADLNQELLTTASKGTAEAVSTGYRARKRKPKILPKGDLPHDFVVVFLDDETRSQLDDRLPNWKERRWVDVTDLDTFMSAYLAIIADMGTTLFPEHGDGGK